MNKIIEIYKKIGQTPLEALNEFKLQNEEFKTEKLAYAGRLDPMAHGILKVLVGDACKERDLYQALDKTYKFQVLFGFATDTYDLMGVARAANLEIWKVENVKMNNGQEALSNQQSATSDQSSAFRKQHANDKRNLGQLDFQDRVMEVLQSFVGEINQTYPVYSSKAVKGKPLFWWAKEGKLDQITIPSKLVNIYKLDLLDLKTITGQEILEKIEKYIPNVNGDFRQVEIVKTWKELLTNRLEEEFWLLTLKANVSSGTYVRSIANDLGKKLLTKALAYDIERISFGTH